ncbi:MAG: Carboxypeptidase regulatory-like domain [Cyanobacteria bacterium RYN_339]|nr:Carboxypeptidase regulatory-like domain [Cyanobacteria bacterium RYN_339]
MSRNVFALTLVASIALAGCSSHPGTLTAAAVVPAASVAVMPTVSVMSDAAPSVSLTQSTAGAQLAVSTSTLRLVGQEEMSDDELADDAASQGYSLQSKIGTPITKTGIVRKTATGYSLETTSGVFKKTTTNYDLVSSVATVTTGLADRLNKKGQVKGTLDANGHTIDVDSFKNTLDLGFLTNWLTRGKISGTVVDGAKKALAGVAVEAKSEDGFVFTDTTDADGNFAIKTLEGGSYSLKLTKTGFDAASSGEHPAAVTSRHNLKFTGQLTATI